MNASVNIFEPLLLLSTRSFRAAIGTNLSGEFLFKNLREGFQGVGMIFSHKHGCLAYVARLRVVIVLVRGFRPPGANSILVPGGK
jgi:hypothetical protein